MVVGPQHSAESCTVRTFGSCEAGTLLCPLPGLLRSLLSTSMMLNRGCYTRRTRVSICSENRTWTGFLTFWQLIFWPLCCDLIVHRPHVPLSGSDPAVSGPNQCMLKLISCLVVPHPVTHHCWLLPCATRHSHDHVSLNGVVVVWESCGYCVVGGAAHMSPHMPVV
jgi:hypothetical protein